MRKPLFHANVKTGVRQGCVMSTKAIDEGHIFREASDGVRLQR